MRPTYTYNKIKSTDGYQLPWWEQIILKPLVYRLVWLYANYTKFTPNQITITSFIFGLLSAYFFLQGTKINLIIGALLFEVSYILDCVDGRIARLKALESKIGGYLDITTDVIKYCFIIICMAYGQYNITRDIWFFLLGYTFLSIEFVSMISNNYFANIRKENKKGANHKEDKKDTIGLPIKDKYSFLMKFVRLKKQIDPENKLSYLPLSSIEGQTITFFLFPILMRIKLGLIIGTIILFIDMLLIAIVNILIKNE